MDPQKLVEILRATIDPNLRENAEQELNKVHKIIGFAPTLLQVVMLEQLDLPVRQAGVIYLKNMIMQFWHERDQEQCQPMPFNIHEQDRAMIRESIVEATIHAPDIIRVQLAVCVSNIVKHDFPSKWTGIVDKVNLYLQSDQIATWMGTLLALYQLAKNYEYKKPEERGPLNEAMQLLLPILHQRCVQLLNDPSEYSVLLQKQILKIFFALVQYFLPMDLISRQMFADWMEIFRVIVDRHVPEATAEIDEDERPELAWWKCKKWALHILTRVFERYGNPGNVTKEYNQFADYYLKTFSGGIIQALLKTLDFYRVKIYTAPRVLQLTLNYINLAVSHAISWKFLKQNMLTIIQHVLFPLMCYTDDDDQLWNTDPHEYIRMKFDIFEDFVSPVTAAQTLLHSVVKKRKDMLQKTMGFVMSILNQAGVHPRQKDGALHMIGTLADILLKKNIYKEQMEVMLTSHVYPEFQNSLGYMRARANWVLHYFCDVRFRNELNLVQAIELTKNCLLNDKDLPVKVEAAIALQMLITNQEKAQKYIEKDVKAIILELLKVIRETENDDLTNVLQKLVCTYVDQVMPIAVEMTQHLAATFAQVLDSNEGSDEKAITAMGLLNTIETILTVMEDHKEILSELESIVLNVIGLILRQNVIEFYEEVLSLVYSLSCQSISENMWQVFHMLYEMFQKDGFDYFTDMMPALHNFVTVDTPAFLANPKHLEIIFNMCKTILSSESGEDPECHAAKLLEVVLLQCKGQIDQCIPSFVNLVLERLTREVKTSELRTMCLQVVIAALYNNAPLLLDTLEKINLPNSTQSITSQFIKQWLQDTDCFLGLHDRKVGVLGLCALLATPPNRPVSISEHASQMIPALLMLFEGLKRAYAERASGEDDDSDDDDDDSDDPEVLESDESDIEEEDNRYIESLSKKAGEDNDDDDVEYSDDGAEETALESYSTPLDEENCVIDEYIVFKNILHNMQLEDPSWYSMLTSQLSPEQQKQLQDVFVLADQRKAAAESKRIEQCGGYVFQNQTVPASFNFGS